MENDELKNMFREKDFTFSNGFSDRLMMRLEEEMIQENYSRVFRHMSWMSAAALVLLFIGAYAMGDNYMTELSYETLDEYLLYND